MFEYNQQQLVELIRGFGEELRELGSVMPAIAQRLVSSVEENFLVGGRYLPIGGVEYEGGPLKWKPSKRTERTGGQTLVNKGKLAASVSAITSENSVTLTSSRVYAAAQHYGAEINHPGGTPYIILTRRSGRGLHMAKGVARFIKIRDVASYEEKRTVRYTRPHRIHLDARPFLVIQPDDYEYIGVVISDYLLAIHGNS